jgi:arylsulfatase A-like enzyme
MAIWALTIIASAVTATEARAQAARTPNVVFVLADDLGYGDVSSFNAQSKLQTPNIDAIAVAGLRFTDAHSGSAVCTPTRYGIMTGRYCWRSSLKKGVLFGYDAPLIEPGRLTVAEMLRGRGYATACVGKWHLGLGWQVKDGETGKPGDKTIDFTKPVTGGPHTAGFDYSFVLPGSLDMDPYVFVEDGKVAGVPTGRIPGAGRPTFYRGGWASPGFTVEGCLPEVTRHAVVWIDSRAKEKGKPFFLYLPLPSPHDPHVPNEQFKGKSGLGPYGDYVMETDWAVGQVAEALRRNGFDGNTLLIVTSDNGAHKATVKLDEKYGHDSSAGSRGQKSDAWEGGHHVPTIARWPGVVAAGGQTNQTVCLTDLMATVAEITGAALPDNAAEDSVSWLPILEGKAKSPVREATVHHSIDGSFAIRQGDWKLVLARGSGGWSQPEAKAPKDAPAVQLYNLKDDPAETKNLQAEETARVDAMKGLLEKYQKEGRSVPARN